MKIGALTIRSPFTWRRAPKVGVDGTIARPPEWWLDFPVGRLVHFGGRRLTVIDRYADCVVLMVGNVTGKANKRRKARYEAALALVKKQKKA